MRVKQFALASMLCVYLVSCQKEVDPKYQRPDWLAGKVYTQIQDTAIFETFAKCLELTGFDTIINTSGSYTVFAPNNDAFDLYFQNHPTYNSVEDIPIDELTKMVKYHIVQNPWSKLQLQQLDVWGWIDTLDENNDEPKGYKRETLLELPDRKYGVRYEGSRFKILDTLSTPWYRRVITDSRKYAPIFFKDYFDIYDLSLNDYTYYFGRSFEKPDDLYYVNGRIVGDEIFAENGFVFNIDRVVQPLDNAYEIISRDYDDKSYSRFKELINRYPAFNYNESETFDQVGADLGLDVDSLFDLTFPDLAFNVTRERTKAPSGTTGLPGNVTIRYHHGMMAPTNEALAQLENEYLSGGTYWDGIDGAPNNICRILTNAHLSANPVYATDLQQGFYNGENDLITLDESSVVQKEYGSNSTFVGLDQAIVPRAFSSITGPIYRRKGYRKVMLTIEESGLLPALKRERGIGEKFMFFVESDENTSADSSLLIEYNQRYQFYEFFAFQVTGLNAQKSSFNNLALRTLLLNHVAVREATGIPRKEFLPTLAGNYIIWNNETGEVSGTVQTTKGFNGNEISVVVPVQISNDAVNGTTYEIDDWFSFSASSLYLRLQTYFPDFHNLIVQSGLANTQLNELTFLSESEYYTVFAPTAAAIEAAQVDTLTQEELQDLVKLHFVRKKLVFTDQSTSSGYYATVREDESSTQFSKKYTNVYLNTDIVDEISIPGSGGGTYTTVVESDSTNIMAGQLVGEPDVVFPMTVINGVIHKIDRVLNVADIQTK